MTLKKFLIIPLILSIGIFVYFSGEVARSFSIIISNVHIEPALFVVLSLAIALHIAGHVIRAYKMSFLLAPVKASTSRFQFRALSIGYLFNTLLPFRLGELIRAQIIAGGEKISFGFALVLIVIERAIDAAFLAAIGIILLVAGVIDITTLRYAAILAIISLFVLSAVAVIGTENRKLLSSWRSFTELFNRNLQQGLRFKAWSIIYGLQRIVSRKRMWQYLVLTLASWSLYFLSIFVVAQYFVGGNTLNDKLALSLSPYYGLSLPAGPANLGTFSGVANDVSGMVNLEGNARITFNLIAWGLLVGPISALGIVFLFVKTKESLWRQLPKNASPDAMAEKLSRTSDISQELASFLDHYFSGNSLSQIVHRLELRKEFRLLRYFKGGSDAITILAKQGKEVVVKKIIPLELKDRLQAQYQWLQRRKSNKGIVQATREQDERDFYAIDLAYNADDEMFFDYMHRSSLQDAERVMKTIWGYLRKSIYSKTSMVTDYVALEQYIDKHIFGCMDKAVAVNEELTLAAQPKRIKINGRSYYNLYQVMEKIKANKKAMRDLATFARSDEVHGDVAVDNILVSRSTGVPLLIDPAPDGNIINGPVFDFGKNMQSLYCGYEFLFRGSEVVSLGSDGSIRYQDQRSTQYTQLCEYVRRELAPQYLSEGEQKAIIFHAGALHIRRLKHQVFQNPANVLAIYGVGVKTLNDFLAQYEPK